MILGESRVPSPLYQVPYHVFALDIGLVSQSAIVLFYPACCPWVREPLLSVFHLLINFQRLKKKKDALFEEFEGKEDSY